MNQYYEIEDLIAQIKQYVETEKYSYSHVAKVCGIGKRTLFYFLNGECELNSKALFNLMNFVLYRPRPYKERENKNA